MDFLILFVTAFGNDSCGFKQLMEILRDSTNKFQNPFQLAGLEFENISGFQ
jgi:hypothetical protein